MNSARSAEGPALGEALVQRWKIGVRVTAGGTQVNNISATVPIPDDWPEQQVREVSRDISPYCNKVDERTINGKVRQLIVGIPSLPAGAVADVTVTFEVTKNAIVAPSGTAEYAIPDFKKLDKDLRLFLGASPLIESKQGKIKSLARQTMAEKETDWEKVEALYDWVRENIEASETRVPLKGATRTLRDKKGDAEDVVNLFVALCRAGNVPARIVWVPGRCYPEFYLIDEEQAGHWFPCEPVAARNFGGIDDKRAILERGDNFRVPEDPKEKYRFVPESLQASRGKPSVKWIREEAE
ncbi:MAG: transglutaminase domain-containing protein [Pirellulales bacterium]